MRDKAWFAVEAYFEEQLMASDPALDAVLEASAAAGLPSITSYTMGRSLRGTAMQPPRACAV
jgi:hypothetical protein